MKTPDFFDNIAPMQMYDPLAQQLGAFADGLISYTYLDMVKLAGHSCPTVAGAWIMTYMGLEKLYGDATPVRGDIKIEMRDGLADGVAGVIGQCIGMVTGACNEGGFKGIGMNYARDKRLFYGCDIAGEVRLSRLDTGQTVTMKYDPSAVPFHPQLRPLMQKVGQGNISADEKAFFAVEWQNRVEKIVAKPEQWGQFVTFV